jgi:GT2 family glycosyltransferase/glycosyltransferase involved in cell wall biosynthesis
MDPMLRVGRLVPDDPRVSIVVLVLEDVSMVEGCLASLRRTIDSSWRAEFVVVANGTSLGRLQDLQHHEDIVLVRSVTNLGFAGGNNLGAGVARGEWLVFLNDDAVVEADWLDQLVLTAETDPQIGAVGSRILFEDGSLQEAGGVIWGDGPTTGVGRNLPPDTTEYLYVRDVDYMSANGMLVRRDAWDRIGGFAEVYHPAYYEDVDLCMSLRANGRRVVYEPRAVLRHLEGGSSSYRYRMFLMGRQRQLFRRRWADELVGREPYPTFDGNAAIERALHRTRGYPPRVLILDDALPDPGIGSGFPRAALRVEELVAQGYAVTLRPFDVALGDHHRSLARTGVMDRLADLGVDVRFEHIGPLLRRSGSTFDVVLCSRPRSYQELKPHLHRLRSQVPVVYDTEAIWHRGMQREALLADSPDRAADLFRQAEEIRTIEMDAIVHADHVVAISEEEGSILDDLRSRGGVTDGAVTVIGREIEQSEPGPAGWEERHNVVFPAGWLAGSGSPNLTSLRFLVEEILPRMVEEVPWIRVLVTGGNPPDEALALAGPNVEFLGYVPDMGDLLNSARVVVVPMLTGAGRKHKTLEAMLAGVPTVSTTVGAEGIDTGAIGGLVVTDDPEGFAQATLTLYRDQRAWAEERGRLEAYCAAHDVQPQTGWASMLDSVIHDGRLRAVPDSYHRWLLATQPPQEELVDLRAESARWSYRPKISVCIPVFNPKRGWLEEAVATVTSQTYENLELCLADDCSTDQATMALLDRLHYQEPRIRTTRRKVNGGISAATNDALALATGEFVAFLDQDDLLAPQALHRVVAHLQAHPDTDLFYCDEDLLSPDRRRCGPFLKPGWSPETLLSFNYITHLVVARRELVEAVGGLRHRFDGAQDHDLLLRLCERTDAICHLDDVLYTWRQSPTSTSMNPSSKPAAQDATVAVVTDALHRRDVAGRVARGRFRGGVVIRYEPSHPTTTTLIVTTSKPTEHLIAAVAAIQGTVTGACDTAVVVAVAEGTLSAGALQRLSRPDRHVLEVPGQPKRAELIAAAAAVSEAEYLVTLDADVAVEGDDWIGSLLGMCALPEVGAVGVRLASPQGQAWHEGIAIGPFGAARITSGDNDFVGVRPGPLLESARDVSAVSGLCTMIRRVAWDKVGGWDPSLPDTASDVDFCVRLGKAGYRIVYTPEVTGTLLGPVRDIEGVEPLGPDPYFSAHLVPGSTGWGLAPPDGTGAADTGRGAAQGA